MQLAF